jgi:hypothetical protein
MGRTRTYRLDPEQAERQDRLDDAMRWARLTWSEFCRANGFALCSLWRWVREGDPTREPRNGGRATSAETISAALGLQQGFMTLGGPRLMERNDEL